MLATLLLNQTNPVDSSHRCISKMPYRRASQNPAVYLALPSFLPAVAATILVPEMTLQANHELLTLTLPQRSANPTSAG
ncbi:hypothetical protein ACNKHU_23785 [Shigella flexneri]